MEGMDGIQLCRSIRAIRHYRETPIIMVTAMHEKSQIEAALVAGATDYVTKPFEMLELVARLRIAENISEKLERLRQRSGKGFPKPEVVDAIPAVHSPVGFADIDQGFLEFADFEAALYHLSKREVMALSILTWRIPEFQAIENLKSDAAVFSLLNAVAIAANEAFGAHEYLAAYYCDGVFVSAFKDCIPTDEDFSKAQKTFNRTVPREFDAVLPFMELKFGNAVRFSTLNSDDPLALV